MWMEAAFAKEVLPSHHQGHIHSYNKKKKKRERQKKNISLWFWNTVKPQEF